MKAKYLILMGVLLLQIQLRAQTPIAEALKTQRGYLHYPRSVGRFYAAEGFRKMWILKDTVKTPAWDAMRLLDGVLRYGLLPADYHQEDISYGCLYTMQHDNVTDAEQARFDVLMTDAIITFINHLHYGKLNPVFSPSKVDHEDIYQFKADRILVNTLEQGNGLASILNVQPHSEAYTNLQRHMFVLTTKYSGRNYVKPIKDIRKMAVNMERLRWINTTGKAFHLTCIVRDGLIINYKDIYRQDKALAQALYNENQVLKINLKINLLLFDTSLK